MYFNLCCFFVVFFHLSSPPQNVMEQFNPGLRNLVNLGKSYEKSVAGELLLYILDVFRRDSAAIRGSSNTH